MENFYLNVPIPPRPKGKNAPKEISLEECLREKMYTEIEGGCEPSDKYHYPPSGQGQGGNSAASPGKIMERTTLLAPPEVCIINLGRAIWDSRGAAKEFRKVVLPDQLDMTPYLETRGQPANQSAKYQLVSVISHRGRTVTQGHYVANILMDGKWYRFDDEEVSEIMVDKVMVGGSNSFTPYLALYEKIPEEDGVGDEQNAPRKGKRS
jgi:ubiquitin C-terminal hydrolase